MHLRPWFLGFSFGIALIAATRTTAAPSPVRILDTSKMMVATKDYVYKAEDTLFTGTVVTNDLAARTITIEGHNPLHRDTVDRYVPRDQLGHERGAPPPPVKTATQVFQVDALCHLAISNKPSARMSSVRSGDVVDVEYRTKTDGTMIASVIRTAAKHPYDTLAGQAPAKAK